MAGLIVKDFYIGFLHWISTWYEEVKNLSTGPWLLLMENCARQELSITLHGVRIELFPRTSTTKHQPWDLGLIASAKIRYRARLLSAIHVEMKLKRNTNHSFKESSSNWKMGFTGWNAATRW